MVSVSPRLRDSLDYEDPEETDPRFSWGFRSLAINSAEYEDHHPDSDRDRRAFAGTPNPSSRRKRRERSSVGRLDQAAPFQYRTVTDGDTFRLCILLPGSGSEPVECKLVLESSKHSHREYLCLSYCWETDGPPSTVSDEAASLNTSTSSIASSSRSTKGGDAAILLDGYRFEITKNLLGALQSLRKPTSTLIIWIDQICINQTDFQERGHQVSIMKLIFSQASTVIVWLGEQADRSGKLFEYARRLRRGEDGNPRNLSRILTQRQLQDALQKLLQRPWFERAWVIPEIVLAGRTTIACADERISWDHLVRLIREVQLPEAPGFDKQRALLGNTRQRIAIMTQMAASQREGLLHTNITQLLILAKGSKATDVRDMIYAFYGLTLLTTFPDYTRSVERLYCDIIHMYVNSIQYEDYYSRWHGLSDGDRTQQLMSILYSAGTLHQHCDLPSWVPDWTYQWYLAPLWCKTTTNIVTSTAKDEWTAGIRTTHRAGGERLGMFEVHERPNSRHALHISVLLVDTIVGISDTLSPSVPHVDDYSPMSPTASNGDIDNILSYGRAFFRTATGMIGVGTRGIVAGDLVVVVLGGDVPVIIRCWPTSDENLKTYELLCECLVTSRSVMCGDLLSSNQSNFEDIVLL